MLQADVGQRRREQRELGEEGRIAHIVLGLHREQPKPGQQRQRQADRRDTEQQGADDLDRKGAEKADQPEVQRQDRADEQPDAENMRGVDEQIGRAGLLKPHGARPGGEPIENLHG
jgi:hypothetical protein